MTTTNPVADLTMATNGGVSDRHSRVWRSAVALLLCASVMMAGLQAPIRAQSRAKDAANGALVGSIIGGIIGAVFYLASRRRSIQVEPSILDFSSVKIGDVARRVVVLRNRTAAPMTVTTLSSSNDVFSFVQQQLPFEIQPHGVNQLTLSFKPESPGKASATIDIRIAAPQRARPPHPKIPVRGEGVR